MSAVRFSEGWRQLAQAWCALRDTTTTASRTTNQTAQGAQGEVGSAREAAGPTRAHP
ncbi:hypothetical protein [Micromonospora sp. NPDC000018]|uniref:hypothetical protein n=1 Tax=Micromonospora sp. NPDC000018 TaxID=3154239 RepID=UPI00331F2AB0